MCVSDRPTDPKILPPALTFFMPKKIIDRQNPEICLRFRVCFRLQQLTLSDKRLIETDLLKTGGVTLDYCTIFPYTLSFRHFTFTFEPTNVISRY
jgi:hypothetical protein